MKHTEINHVIKLPPHATVYGLNDSVDLFLNNLISFELNQYQLYPYQL